MNTNTGDDDDTYYPGKPFSMLRTKPKKGAQRPHKGMRKTGKWKCCKCGLIFAGRTNLNTHLKYTHSDYAYKCPCSKAFSRPSILRYHIRQYHPELDPSDPSLCERVKRTDLTEAQQRTMKKYMGISRKRKFYQNDKKVLPFITAFNCHDCEGVYRTINDLFEHCRLAHRTAEDGTKFRYLVPPLSQKTRK